MVKEMLEKELIWYWKVGHGIKDGCRNPEIYNFLEISLSRKIRKGYSVN